MTYVNGLWLAHRHSSRKGTILKLTTVQIVNMLGLAYTPVNSLFGNGLMLHVATNRPVSESIFLRYVCAPPL